MAEKNESSSDTNTKKNNPSTAAASVATSAPTTAGEFTTAAASSVANSEFTELDWITLKNDLVTVEHEKVESSTEKFKRKYRENPFVPIGCGLTTIALCYGLYSFTRGKRDTSQTMMRLRIAAQGITVAALMLGIVKTNSD